MANCVLHDSAIGMPTKTASTSDVLRDSSLLSKSDGDKAAGDQPTSVKKDRSTNRSLLANKRLLTVAKEKPDATS